LRRSESRDDTPTDQFTLKFRNTGEDSEYQPTIWGRGVHALVQADEVDAQRTEFLQRIHQLPNASGKSVVSIDKNCVYFALAAICPEPIQFVSALTETTDALVDVLADDVPTTTARMFPEFLDFGCA
jgi:hypothetical protein